MIIELTKGQISQVDGTDFDWLNQWKWYAGSKRSPYARRGDGVMMHRLIMGNPKSKQVDHINRDPLDNRRANLRLASAQLQQFNQPLQSNNTSGIRGVYYHKNKKRWYAMIRINGQLKFIGSFLAKNDAIKARHQSEVQSGLR